jgi:hypothetical protein
LDKKKKIFLNFIILRCLKNPVGKHKLGDIIVLGRGEVEAEDVGEIVVGEVLGPFEVGIGAPV